MADRTRIPLPRVPSKLFEQYGLRVRYQRLYGAILDGTVLQDLEPRLYDPQNRMTYQKVQNMMRQIVDARQSSGINPYKSISDDTMQALWNLRDDLRRSASAQELARTPLGSDSVQNALDVAKQYGRAGLGLAVHGVANAVAPGTGSIALNAVKGVVAPIQAARAQRQAISRGRELLHPDPSQLRNPLAPP